MLQNKPNPIDLTRVLKGRILPYLNSKKELGQRLKVHAGSVVRILIQPEHTAIPPGMVELEISETGHLQSLQTAPAEPTLTLQGTAIQWINAMLYGNFDLEINGSTALANDLESAAEVVNDIPKDITNAVREESAKLLPQILTAEVESALPVVERVLQGIVKGRVNRNESKSKAANKSAENENRRNELQPLVAEANRMDLRLANLESKIQQLRKKQDQ